MEQDPVEAGGLRVAVVVLGAALALALMFAGSIFGLNGSQWKWWSYASWLGAISVVLGLVVLALSRLRPVNSPFSSAIVLLGMAVVCASLIVMAKRYSDPYGGEMVLPHSLAVTALAGLIAAELGAIRLLRGSRFGR